MKKLIFLFVILMLTFVLLISCAKDEPIEEETPVNPEELTNSLMEEAVACYYSLLTEDGFGNYILAFPSEWRIGYQGLLEYDDETFEEAIRNATETIHTRRDEEYEYGEFHIEYEYASEKDVTGEEFDYLADELSSYCFITRSTIEKMKKVTNSVHRYAITAGGDIIKDTTSNEELIMLYITDEGWCVSPQNFELP